VATRVHPVAAVALQVSAPMAVPRSVDVVMSCVTDKVYVDCNAIPLKSFTKQQKPNKKI
jgi:hypothetical protein